MRKAWNKKNTEQFIEQCKEKHKGYYTYSDTLYTGSTSKVTVGCPDHGNFDIVAQKHLEGQRCKLCANLAQGMLARHSIEDFKTLAEIVHGNKYDYSLVELKLDSDVVEIVCTMHEHKFWQTPRRHKQGAGCPICAREATTKGKRLTTEKFKAKAEKVNGNRYDYSRVAISEGGKVKVEIGCKQAGHGTFWMSPNHHNQGRGCPKCSWEGSGYSQTKPGSFYVLSYQNITKVGITNRKVDDRIKGINRDSGLGFELKFSVHSDDGATARKIELQVLAWLRLHYKNVETKFDGYTECFLDVDTDALTNFIVPIAGSRLE